MKNKRKSVCLFLLMALLFGVLAGCKNDGEVKKLEDTVHEIQGLEDYAPSGTLAKIISENTVYEVVDISWEGDSGVAEVKVSTPDLSRILSDSIQAAMEEYEDAEYDVLLEKAKENFWTMLNSTDAPSLERTVEMDAKKTEDGYTLISNDDFENIISGNLGEILIDHVLEVLE